MQHGRSLRTTLVILALLVCLTAGISAAAHQQQQRQSQRNRLRAFARYAERVGAALELLTSTSTHATDRKGDPSQNDYENEGNTADESEYASPSASTGVDMTGGSDNPFTMLGQFMEYPHTVVRGAVQAVTARAGALHTLTSVLVGRALSEKAEAQLQKVQRTPMLLETTGSVGSSPQPIAASVAAARWAAAERKVRTTPASAALSPGRETLPKSASSRRVSTLADTSSSSYITCQGGYVALASNTPMHCNAAGTTTIGEYPSIPEADRETCYLPARTFSELEQQCVCSNDSYIIKLSDTLFTCTTRPLDLQVLLEDRYLCNSTADAALGLNSTMESEYCIKTTRTATLSLAVIWKYTYLSDDAIKAAAANTNVFLVPMEVPTSASGLTWVVMGQTPPAGIITAENGSPYVKGSYSALSLNTSLFTFLTAPSSSGDTTTTPVYISSGSTLYQSYAFSAVFCFAAPRKTTDHLKETRLSSDSALTLYLGNPNGTTAHTFTLDLSSVSDDFVEGNQMYVETGMRGGSAVYSYRVARLHIAFTDLAVPSDKTYHYKKQFNPLYILLIAAIGVIVVGAGLAILWYYLMRDEEIDDKLVADAQRKKKPVGARAAVAD